MNLDRDLDRTLEHVLDEWLSDGATLAAGRVLDGVADRISRQPQRRTWHFITWRSTIMSRTIRLTALAAASLAIVAGAMLLGGGTAPPAPPAPSESPSAVASPSPGSTGTPSAPPSTPAPTASAATAAPASPSAAAIECRSPQAPSCVGRLEPGTYQSLQFTPRFSYTVPADWWNFDAWTTTYAFHRFGDPADQLILMYSDPGIAERSETCDGTAIAGKDATAADWHAFFSGHPGLQASEPIPVDIGGRPALAVDIAVREDWTTPCFGARVPVVRYATDLYWPFDGWGIAVGERRRLIPVDSPDGRVVLIEIDTNTAPPFEEFVAAAMLIVESITFAD